MNYKSLHKVEVASMTITLHFYLESFFQFNTVIVVAEIQYLCCKAFWLSLNSLGKKMYWKGEFSFTMGKEVKKRNYGAKKEFWTSCYVKVQLNVLFHLPLLVLLGWEIICFYIQLCHSYAVEKKILDNTMEFQTEWMNW